MIWDSPDTTGRLKSLYSPVIFRMPNSTLFSRVTPPSRHVREKIVTMTALSFIIKNISSIIH